MRKRSNEEIEPQQREIRTRFGTRLTDDSSPSYKIFTFTPELRQEILKTVSNPLGYPHEYFTIYEEEKMLRNPIQYQNCLNITSTVLNTKSNPIQLIDNINCLKSKPDHILDGYLFPFSEEFINILRNDLGYNIEIVQDYDENGDYVEMLPRGFNNLNIILYYLSYVFRKYKDYVCIAGGFALSYYLITNYGYATKFGDIDIFIHSCNEEIANEIVKLFETTFKALSGEPIFEEENSIYTVLGIFDPDVKFFTPIGISIIKRLYISPSEIIHGFDIDSCCILVNMYGEIWITKRGAYAIKNGYNVVNFDRMSPSYEYRLTKYHRRGFAIWIPQIDYFKSNVVFDANHIGFQGSDVIIRYLIQNAARGYELPGISDYQKINRVIIRPDEENYRVKYPVKFKTLNPGEQINNSFHQQVYEDPIEWYPRNGKLAKFFDNFVERPEEIIIISNINTDYEIENVSGSNVLRKSRSKKENTYLKQEMKLLLKTISEKSPSSYIIGDVPYSALTGLYPSYSTKVVYIWDPRVTTIEIATEFAREVYYNYGLSLVQKRYFENQSLTGYFVPSDSGIVFDPFTIPSDTALVEYYERIVPKSFLSLKTLNHLLNDPETTYDNGPFLSEEKRKSIISFPTVRYAYSSPYAERDYSRYETNTMFLNYVDTKEKSSQPFLKYKPELPHFKQNQLIGQLPNEKLPYDRDLGKIKIVFLDPTISLDKYVRKLEAFEQIKEVFYQNGNFYSTRQVSHDIKNGLKNCTVLKYPIYENYVAAI